jgi:2-(1,2-epoxy-1,2-dihydrophenyl)acetyl-CoA isomerase
MEFITNSKVNSVAIIRLNRPDKYNSFNRDMALQMQKAIAAASADENIRAVMITAEGKAFCAGQDLSEAVDSNGPGIEKIVSEHYNPIIKAIREIEKPVVCAVNGVAAGAGANIALACDIVFAARSVSFIQAFSKIGLIPDSGGTYFLPRLIGLQKATAMMMLGEKVSAQDAFEMGMIYKVTDDGMVYEEALKTAVTLSEMPTKALGLTKRLLNNGFNNNLNQQLKDECKMQIEAAATNDYKEGVQAFLEKRKPLFKGN